MSFLTKKLQQLHPFLRRKKEKSNNAADSTSPEPDEIQESACHTTSHGSSVQNIQKPAFPPANAEAASHGTASGHSESSPLHQPAAMFPMSSLPPITVYKDFGIPVNTNPGNLGLKDFEIQRTLGTGSFGRVHLVRYKASTQISGRDEFYAMKVMRKSKIVELKQVDHTLNERNLLARFKHPFIVELLCTFQDAHNIYIIMEFVVGGEIFSILRRAKNFPNDIAKFYGAEVILAFEYLHSMDIVFRDLKPENLLIGQDGHIKLTDFGFAKYVPDVTRTLCGTPEYLAPEIIRSKDYGKSVDWYALGILLYEMLSGYPPYYHENHVKLYESVLEGKMRFPAHFDPMAIDLIQKLTARDVSMRYGNLRDGVLDIKNHPWFHGVHWQKLLEKRIKPPYIPKLQSPGDARHFELYPEEKIPYDQLPDIVDPYGALFSGI